MEEDTAGINSMKNSSGKRYSLVVEEVCSVPVNIATNVMGNTIKACFTCPLNATTHYTCSFALATGPFHWLKR